MLETIIAALRERTDLSGWSVRHIINEGVQLYAVPNAVEARRKVQNERFLIDVLRDTTGTDGKPTVGSANTTLLPGDDIHAAINAAALMAGLVHNPPYSLVMPAAQPEVPLADPDLHAGADAAIDQLLERVREVVADQPHVRLTASEWFADQQTIRLYTSQGIDMTQAATMINGEVVLMCREGDQEVETFLELGRRRVHDINVEAEISQQAQQVMDSLHATLPPSYSGPVVIQGATLATFLNGGTIQTLAAGQTKLTKTSPWEIGQTIFRGPVEGDPLTLYANRQLPFGTHANQFDDEGLPAQRIELIRDNVLTTFIASQRHAQYLNLAPTGGFGDIEIPAGRTPAAELLAEPFIEVVDFSWFNPDPITGEFASEIRLGYLVENGKRTPFKGGVLVGNLLDALANVRWSSETGFYGNYQGPTTARFGKLTVAGEGGAA